MTIPLANTEEVCLVSREDYEWCSQRKWHKSTNGYVGTSAKTKDGEPTSVLIHTLILKTPPKHYVDHINRNKLDNRRENLRVATPSQNMVNACYAREKKKYSGFKGVTWHKNAKKFYAFGVIKGSGNRIIGLGFYETEVEAALAFNFWAAHTHGEFAYLNPVHV